MVATSHQVSMPSSAARPQSLRVILILSTVVFIIHVLSVLLGMVLSLLAVDEIHSFCLCQLVYFGAGEANEEFLGELVGDWLAWGRTLERCI